MKLIVGLGNPGKEYSNTRHNVGFMIIDQIIKDNNWQEKFDGLCQIINIQGEKVLFLKPMTYMNLSGNAVSKAVHYYNVAFDDILIIQDDMDMDFGKIKLKKNSSAGGHNGIKSIISSLDCNCFCRLKVGIGHDRNQDTVDYVLGKFSKAELNYFSENAILFQNIIESFVINGSDMTMNKYNS